MRKPMRRIIAVLLVVALLPIGFILYELTTLSENERIVRESYQNQLDAILYSINQYSDDVISSWANRLNIALMDEKNILDSTRGIPSLFQQFGALQYIYLTDTKHKSMVSDRSMSENETRRRSLDSLVTRHQHRVERLFQYESAGFRKMELLDTVPRIGLIPVFFVLNKGTPNYSLGAMIINLPHFIENTLGPKMQAIAQQKFVITAFREDRDSLVYTTATEPEQNILDSRDESQKKSFWLLPGYYLTISINGATINDLVKDRLTTTVVILALLVFILGLGIWFLYRNIKREMHLAQAKSEFVSNVSHEIRTPLSLISMYAETLEMNRVSEEKKKEYHHVIAQETSRLSGIVNRILNFSQIQANKKTYETKAIQLNDLVGDVLKSYFFHLQDKGFTCEFLKDPDIAMISGDRESITEAIINLLDNAMKYSRDKKHIMIRTGREGKFNFIEVTDQGIGIAKKYQAEIFDQFYRAPTGDVHNTKGSGLGLTLVKKTMDAHHGRIKVDSASGRGSSFWLYFPFKNEVAS
jgi:two-component system phosphate regulon sensor histidine kinase PhoR